MILRGASWVPEVASLRIAGMLAEGSDARLRRQQPLWRRLTGVRLVAVVVTAGMIFAGIGGGISLSGVARTAGALAVRVSLTEGVSVAPGQDFSLAVTVTNQDTQEAPATRVEVFSKNTALENSTALSEWLADNSMPSSGIRSLGTVDVPTIAGGESATVTLAVAASKTRWASSWGVRGLAAEVQLGDEQVALGHGSLVFAGDNAPGSTGLITVLPVVAPASADGIIPVDELGALTADTGVLSRQLTFALTHNVALAVDPRIIASIHSAGNDAPASAKNWLTLLRNLPRSSFLLGYGDVDLTAETQAGMTTLLSPGFSDLPNMAPFIPTPVAPTETAPASATATDSPSTSSAATPTPTPSPRSDDFVPTLSGLAWPRANTVLSSDVPVLAANGATRILLSSQNLALSAALPVSGTVQGSSALVSNAGLSAAVSDAAAATDDASWQIAFSTAAAYLAVSASESAGTGLTLATLPRTSSVWAEGNRFASTLDALTAVDWSRTATLPEALGSPGGELAVADHAQPADRMERVSTLLGRQAEMASFSTALTTPSLLLDASTRNLMSLLSVAYAESAAWPRAIASNMAQTGTVLSGITVISSSDINMVGTQAQLPITIENTLPYEVNVLVRATTPSARLQVEPQVPLTVQPESQGKAKIPATARVSNGVVLLGISLSSPTGVVLGNSMTVPVNIHADWEMWGFIIIGALLVILIVAGVVRTRRRLTRSTSADDDAPGVEKVSG